MGTATGWNHPAQISRSLVTHWPTLFPLQADNNHTWIWSISALLYSVVTLWHFRKLIITQGIIIYGNWLVLVNSIMKYLGFKLKRTIQSWVFPLQLLHKTLCRETFGLHLTYETHSFDRLFIWEAIHFMLQLSKHCGLLTQYIATWIWVNTGSGNGLLPASTLTLPSLRIKRRSEVNDRKNSLQSFKSF